MKNTVRVVLPASTYENENAYVIGDNEVAPHTSQVVYVAKRDVDAIKDAYAKSQYAKWHPNQSLEEREVNKEIIAEAEKVIVSLSK